VASQTILSAPDIEHPAEVALRLRRVGVGAVQLVQEIASGYSDRQLQTAAAWLATDLGAVAEAAAIYIEGGAFQLSEAAPDSERCEDMARLLEIGSVALGHSEERRFVAEGIRQRLERERAALNR